MPLSPMRKNASGFSAFGQLDASKSSDKFQLHHRAAVSINGLVKLHSISRFQFEKRRNKAFDPTNLSKQESLRGIHKKVACLLFFFCLVLFSSRFPLYIRMYVDGCVKRRSFPNSYITLMYILLAGTAFSSVFRKYQSCVLIPSRLYQASQIGNVRRHMEWTPICT